MKYYICMDSEVTYKGQKRKTFSYLLTYTAKFFENFHTTGIDNLLEVYKR